MSLRTYLGVVACLLAVAVIPTGASEPAATKASATSFKAICPYLPAQDLERGARFYTEVLGFQVKFREGTTFVLLQRDEIELALTQAEKSVTPATCLIRVMGIDALHKLCLDAKAPIDSPLETKPWGMKMFRVKDPEGNLLDFGEAVNAPKP